MHAWTETHLWQRLIASQSPELPSIRGFFDQWMPRIERVLNAGTSPKDFTLHDADHSFRVAQRMAEIVPADVLPKLSAYELALLLLSAYLHDIGMTPEQAQVERHWRHLVFGPLPEGEGGISEQEMADLQRWLDDERGGVVPPLARDGRTGEEDLRLAGELTTYYARHQHNDWSEAWIRQNAAGDLGSYEGWVDDLVTICRSHHEGYDELRTERFDPRPVGRRNEVVHLRYLACVLRIADILDMDPERTPPVLFQHRDIAEKSVIFWWKDHDLSIHRDGPALVVHARPRSAVVEKAVRDTADWIRVELETCARLSREEPFSHAPFRASAPLPHHWDFPEALLLQVKPRNDAYVYIDGAFRPNTARLLELLSGIQLYKNPLAAVRELLQNAFDAVKEEIALQRLAGDPADARRLEAITALQRVELRLEEKDGRSWLLCTDTGVGMTRQIIESYLLVSGNSRRHDILDLERQCEAAGFHLGRTGQFGIGVLSYFMLADRVEIRTRRSAARNDAEPHGWQFETDGVGSFGELKKEPRARPGTEVRLRLRKDLAADRMRFLAELKLYLVELLLRLPCSFRLVVADATPAPLLTFVGGWQPLEQQVLNERIEEASRLLSIKRFPEWRSRLNTALRWATRVGSLPDGLGELKISVPFFDLPGGRCAVFFDVFTHESPAEVRDKMGHYTLFDLRPRLRTSFQGLDVRSALPNGELLHNDRYSFLCEIDWESKNSGQVSVDRTTFVLSYQAAEALSWALSQAEAFQGEVLSEGPTPFASLNRRISKYLPEMSEPWWLMRKGREIFWGPVVFPAIKALDLGYASPARWMDRDVSILETLAFGPIGGFQPGAVAPGWDLCSAYRLVLVMDAPRKLTLLYGPTRSSVAVAFPPAWGTLCSFQAEFREGVTWNPEHALVKAIDAAELNWLDQSGFPDTLPPVDELLASKGRAAAFVTQLSFQDFGFALHAWNAFEKDHPGLRSQLWRLLFPDAPETEVSFWAQNDLGELLVLGAQGIKRLTANDPRIGKYLPDPGEEWRMTVEEGEDFVEYDSVPF